MTLFKQISLVVLVLFGIVFCGTLGISINNTRQYLNDQLASHAQDAATSLGLSLSPHMDGEDRAVITSMVDAIFDRGYYRQITLKYIAGETVVERANEVKIEGVPSWFIRLIPLDTPKGEAMVMAGWNQAGTLTVISHPGYAYDELWRTAVTTLRWLLVCMAIALGLGSLLLGVLLRPLKAVERQAEGICNRSYTLQEAIPHTRELKQVVLAMNRMVSRVRQMFEEQSALSESLRAQAYVDGVSGLGNRRYFDSQIQQLLGNREDRGVSALLLLELEGFKEFNDRHGYQAGDELIAQVASMIRQTSAEQGDTLIARLSGASFALLLPSCSADDVGDLAQRLCEGLGQMRPAGFSDQVCTGYVGGALLTPDADSSQWLANADQALRAAPMKGPNSFELRTAGIPGGHPKGAREWRSFLEKVIDQRRFALHFQPVVELTSDRSLMHREVLLRIHSDTAEPMTAGTFLPMAERVGLGREIDKACVAMVFDHIRSKQGTSTSYAVNLAAPSLADSNFVTWLANTLRTAPDAATRIVFEIAEYGAVANLEATRDFVRRIAHLGARFSLDHFGRGFTSFAYLQSVPVDYLKIDSSFIRNIDTDKDNQFFVQALAKAAHDLEIKIIAENVENEAQRETLINLKIDGVQGYLVGRPAESGDAGVGVA